MKYLSILPLSFLLFTACDAAPTDATALTKAEAEALMSAKADGEDLCELHGWYDDDVCDAFCPNPDLACFDAEPECIRTGCGGEICAEEPMFSTCEVKPETICLDQTVCEFQAEAQSCGFTMTPEVQECLDEVTSGDDVWLTYAPTQCGTNPWQMNPSSSNSFSHLEAELASIAAYYEGQGMHLKALGLVNYATPQFTCLACSCPRGDRLVVRAGPMQAQNLKAVGFSGLTDALGVEPVSCQGNPWDSFIASSELESVLKWGASLGADIHELGLVFDTTPKDECLACDCARGDELVVIPTNVGDSAILENKGLAPL